VIAAIHALAPPTARGAGEVSRSRLALLRPPLRWTLLPAEGVMVLETALAPLDAAVAVLAFPLPLVSDRAEGFTRLSSLSVGPRPRRLRHAGNFSPAVEHLSMTTLEAFIREHEYCGELDTGGRLRGAGINRNVDRD
jgi:hypothetical protein